MPDLLHVDLNLTNACNFSCAHCHSSSGVPDANELDTKRIIDLIDEIFELGAVTLAIAGGEPFLRKDIFDILGAAERLGSMRTAVITNGSLLTKATLARLKEVAPDVSLSVSLDGATPAQFGRLRARPGASPASTAALFRRIVDAVRGALAVGLDTSINFTLTNESLEDLDAAYSFAVDNLGASALVAMKFFPGGYGRKQLDRLNLPWTRWSHYFSSLTERRLSGELPQLQISLPSAWEFYLPLIESGIDCGLAEDAWNNRAPLRDQEYAKHRDIGDPIGVANLAICGDGSVYPSVLLVGETPVACGSVAQNILDDVWQNSSVLEDLRRMTVSDLTGNCCDCPIVDFCGGGSRSRAYLESGRLEAADIECPIIDGIRYAV